jgi:hypothetical protein
LSDVLLELLSSPVELKRTRDLAYALAGEMAWPQVGGAYFAVIRSTVRAASQDPEMRWAAQPLAVTSLPDLSLDHLLRMTDDTGIIQHASYSVPARSTGYCVDDNARALIVAVRADRIQGGPQARALVFRYLAYLHASQREDGSFHNFMSYERVLDSARASDDCVGRAIWALGVTASLAADDGCRMLAREMLTRALAHTAELGPRGTAQVVLGLVTVLATDGGAVDERRLLDRLVAKLLDTYRANATDEWCWFESTLTYDNAILPLALFAAYSITGERGTLHDARASLDFLEEVCFHEDQVQLVGNTGWHSAGGEKASADEQAIDATALVLAFSCAYSVTKDRHYLRRMHEAFAWFLGSNRIGMPLYDFATGGCHDGIGVSHVNRNQGAESTVCFLMALLEMLEMDTGKLEPRHPTGGHLPPGANAAHPH